MTYFWFWLFNHVEAMDSAEKICNFFIIIFITEAEYKVKTKWIAADFSKGKEVYRHIENELSGIPVGILGKFERGNYRSN